MNNFGDLLGPMIVRALLRREGIVDTEGKTDTRLLSVGSVLHFAGPGDHIWGSGWNGKLSAEVPKGMLLHAVRGPRTAELLTRAGYTVPPVFGDPALLLPELLPTIGSSDRRTTRVLLLGNINDGPFEADGLDHLRADAGVSQVVSAIRNTRFLVTSSLHGLIVGEAFGTPVRLVASSNEGEFKYLDYLEGTGRGSVEFARSIEEALEMGPNEQTTRFDSRGLVDAFPFDLWT